MSAVARGAVWLTAADPEPGWGAVVETTWGAAYHRDPDDCLPAAWSSLSGEPETWRHVAGNLGPVRVLARGYDEGVSEP